ncbi:hypothetical protein N7449_001199, partial [Penicillium cf. viridicatum]
SSPKKDLPALIWTPSHFLPPSSSSSLSLPLQLPFVQQFCIVVFPRRATRSFRPRLDPSVFANRSGKRSFIPLCNSLLISAPSGTHDISCQNCP